MKQHIRVDKIRDLKPDQLRFFQGKLMTRQSLRMVSNYIIVGDKTGLPDTIAIPVTIDGLPDTITYNILSDADLHLTDPNKKEVK